MGFLLPASGPPLTSTKWPPCLPWQWLPFPTDTPKSDREEQVCAFGAGPERHVRLQYHMWPLRPWLLLHCFPEGGATEPRAPARSGVRGPGVETWVRGRGVAAEAGVRGRGVCHSPV